MKACNAEGKCINYRFLKGISGSPICLWCGGVPWREGEVDSAEDRPVGLAQLGVRREAEVPREDKVRVRFLSDISR